MNLKNSINLLQLNDLWSFVSTSPLSRPVNELLQPCIYPVFKVECQWEAATSANIWCKPHLILNMKPWSRLQLALCSAIYKLVLKCQLWVNTQSNTICWVWTISMFYLYSITHPQISASTVVFFRTSSYFQTATEEYKSSHNSEQYLIQRLKIKKHRSFPFK